MKKAILVVSFGTSHLDALNNSIKKIEDSIQENFKEYDVFRSFTSHMIVRKLKEKHNMEVLFPEDALKKLGEEGYEEVIVQPLHIIPGEEFDYIKHMVKEYEPCFKKIEIGRPIFHYEGFESGPDDYSYFVDTMKDLIEKNSPCVFVGHGSAHPSNAVYGCLQSVLIDKDYEDVFVGTVEGYPNFSNVLKKAKKKDIKEITIIPLKSIHARVFLTHTMIWYSTNAIMMISITSVTPIFGLSIQERYLSIKAYNADPISRICSLPLKQSFLIYRHEVHS